MCVLLVSELDKLNRINELEKIYVKEGRASEPHTSYVSPRTNASTKVFMEKFAPADGKVHFGKLL